MTDSHITPEVPEDIVRHDPTDRGPLPLAHVALACRLVDSVKIPALLERWEDTDRTTPGGRPPVLTMRAVLALWLIVAAEEQPLHLTRLARILAERMTPKVAAALGIPFDPKATRRVWYDRVQRTTSRILRIVDANPIPNRSKRMTRAEHLALLEWRQQHEAALGEKARRRQILTNMLLEATYMMVPKQFRPNRASIAIDATPIRSFAVGIGRDRLEKMQPEERVSIEPDSGFYDRRTENHSPADGKASKKYKYALDLELAVLVSNDPSLPDAVPHIVLAMGLHRPGSRVGEEARGMVESLYERGHRLDHFIADRAYLPGAKADVLQGFLREKGAKVVMDYRKDQLGIQAQFAGAIMVDGSWYSPGMPKHLIDASKPRAKALEDDEKNQNLTTEQRTERRAALKAAHQQAVAERSRYLVRPKEKADERGRTPMACPAAGPSPTVICELKPRPDLPTSKLAGLLPVITPPKVPGKLCTNSTSTSFPTPADPQMRDIKYAQYYEYGSAEWYAHFDHGRNTIESFNAYLKDGPFDLENRRRRRLRGLTAQHLLAAVGVAAANLAKIRDFLDRMDSGRMATASPKAPDAVERRGRRAPTASTLTTRKPRSQKRTPRRT